MRVHFRPTKRFQSKRSNFFTTIIKALLRYIFYTTYERDSVAPVQFYVTHKSLLSFPEYFYL